MLQIILDWLLGNYNKRIERSMSAFTKIVAKCQRLNEKMNAEILRKNEKINQLNEEIKDIEKSVERNFKFITNVQKITG